MPPKTCVVSFTGATGISHGVEVVAETLYEAAALGLSLLRAADWGEIIGPGTRLEVQVREPAITHTVTVQQIHRWCDGVAIGPEEVLKRRKVKAMLA